MVTGNAMVCGVIGNPVGHSLSPLMHNEIAKALGLDYIYVPCPVEHGTLGEAIRGAYALGFAGLNVTVPYKQEVIPFLAETDVSVRCIGACNTLVRLPDNAAANKGYKGYNTDAEGLFRAMRGQGMEIRGRDCLLIGAGGAARAAAYLLVREGAASVTVLNRTPDKAEALAEDMRRMAADGGEIAVAALPLVRWRELPGNSYLAIQTTSVGMHPHTDAAPVEDMDFYRKIAQAVDIIYTPSETRFMKHVKAAGGQAAGGLDMLICQGVAALELWNPGLHVPDEVIGHVREIMEERLNG